MKTTKTLSEHGGSPDTPDTPPQQVCLAVTIETPQLGAINVLTTHLTLSETARMNNVYEICKYAKSLESDPKRGKVYTNITHPQLTKYYNEIQNKTNRVAKTKTNTKTNKLSNSPEALMPYRLFEKAEPPNDPSFTYFSHFFCVPSYV